MLADICSTPEVSTFSPETYSVSYDVLVGQPVSFFMPPAIIFPENCWLWDGYARVLEDASLLVTHDDSILTYIDAEQKVTISTTDTSLLNSIRTFYLAGRLNDAQYTILGPYIVTVTFTDFCSSTLMDIFTIMDIFIVYT